MKLLFDHHLSPSLVRRLGDLFPGSDHVWNLGLDETPDLEIWHYARTHDYIIASKDADFSEISMHRGYPPKLIWLRLGNCTTDEVEELIRTKYLLIAELERSPDRGILQLFSRNVR